MAHKSFVLERREHGTQKRSRMIRFSLEFKTESEHDRVLQLQLTCWNLCL